MCNYIIKRTGKKCKRKGKYSYCFVHSRSSDPFNLILYPDLIIMMSEYLDSIDKRKLIGLNQPFSKKVKLDNIYDATGILRHNHKHDLCTKNYTAIRIYDINDISDINYKFITTIELYFHIKTLPVLPVDFLSKFPNLESLTILYPFSEPINLLESIPLNSRKLKHFDLRVKDLAYIQDINKLKNSNLIDLELWESATCFGDCNWYSFYNNILNERFDLNTFIKLLPSTLENLTVKSDKQIQLIYSSLNSTEKGLNCVALWLKKGMWTEFGPNMKTIEELNRWW